MGFYQSLLKCEYQFYLFNSLATMNDLTFLLRLKRFCSTFVLNSKMNFDENRLKQLTRL